MKNILITLFISFLSFSSYAQEKALTKANEAFDVYAYLEAAGLYEKALFEEKDDKNHKHILSRLGDCYYKISDSKNASVWYKRAIVKFPDINSEYLWKYVQTLRSLGRYEEANEPLMAFKDRQAEDDDSRAQDFEFVNLKNLLDPNSEEAKKVSITNLNSNTEYSDFDGHELNGKFFFSAANRNGVELYSKEDKLYKWNKEPYLNIYEGTIVKTTDAIEISEVSKIPSDFPSREIEHEGTMAMTRDGNTLYFTGNNVAEGKRAYDNDKGRMRTSNLKLYRAIRKNDKWENVTELPFNGDNYSTGHPALSPDENSLYFVSDTLHPDAQGKTDLYKVQIYGDGSFGEMVNLKGVNTVHREMFPFIAADSTLYFSSDGHVTGLLDIFKSDILKRADGEPVTRENLGAPYNSGADDFAYFTNDNGKTGYFSSNRDGGKGSDDIYAFRNDPCEKIISGITYGKAITDIDAKPLPGVEVKLKDQSGNIIASTTSNESGIYVFVDLDHENVYSISGEKVNYILDSRQKPFTDIKDCKISQDLELISFEIGIVLFEFDKHGMNETMDNSIAYLDNLIEIMKKYPNMEIKISSHTDLRGSKAYNENLSKQRAQSTYDYVIRRINDATRLSYGWYGECTPYIECGNYCDTKTTLNKCTDDERKLNRRSEFEILNPEDIGLKQN